MEGTTGAKGFGGTRLACPRVEGGHWDEPWSWADSGLGFSVVRLSGRSYADMAPSSVYLKQAKEITRFPDVRKHRFSFLLCTVSGAFFESLILLTKLCLPPSFISPPSLSSVLSLGSGKRGSNPDSAECELDDVRKVT